VKSIRRIILALLVLFSITIACSFLGIGKREVEIALGEEIRIEKAGFAFQEIPSYDQIITGRNVSMIPPDVDFGLFTPGVFMYGGIVESESFTLEDLYLKTVDMMTSEPSSRREITIDDAPGLAADLKSKPFTDGSTISGRMVVVLVTPNQQFIMIGEAPTELWEDELVYFFDAVQASVHFFEPEH
jgi:hypothetical protein